MALILDLYKDKIVFFDNQSDAPWAALEYGPQEWEKLERLKVELEPLPGKTILEPGCGTGRLTAILSEWVGPSGRVTALDISPKMMDRARRRLAGRGNVILRQAAMEDLAHAPASFDVVLHHQVFPHYHDQALALEITGRAVKPGGLVVICHFINTDTINDDHRQAGTAVEHDLMPAVDELRRMFPRAGLAVKSVTDDDHGFFLSAFRPTRRFK